MKTKKAAPTLPGESYAELKGNLEALYSVLGKAVLIPVKIWGPPDADGNFGAKGRPLYKGWPNMTYDLNQNESYQRELAERFRTNNNKLGLPGNIAVLLGAPSENLVAYDFDRAALIEPFLETNPALRNTLRISTFRGQQVFVRLNDEYPNRVCPILVNGEMVGEFRGGKGLSTVFGVHPKRRDDGSVVLYDYVCTRPVLSSTYSQIILPEGWMLGGGDDRRKTRRNSRDLDRAREKLKPGMFDIEALWEAIACDVEGLCAELFSNGYVSGRQFHLGDKTGISGSSLAVQLTGEYAGNWVDWATGDHGDLIDLVRSVYGESFSLAVRHLEQTIGETYRIEEEGAAN